MLHPSYSDLMKVVNKDVEEGETKVVNSRYSIVMATSKRARQIVDGSHPLVRVSTGEKPLSIAVDELDNEKVKILSQEQVEELEAKAALEEAMKLAEEEAANETSELISDESLSEGEDEAEAEEAETEAVDEEEETVE